MILKELKWDRSTHWFSFPHHFTNIYPKNYVDPRSSFDWSTIKFWSTL